MIFKSANQLRCDLNKAKQIMVLTLLNRNKSQLQPYLTIRMVEIGVKVKKAYQSSLIHRNIYTYRSQQKFIDFKKDYYEILGVEQKAQFQQIKQKYYHLAKQYHPDRSKGNQSKFKQITQAYNVLSQQKLRKQYDQKRQTYSEDDLDQSQNNLKNEQHSSSLNYAAYSQMSKAQWAVYRSGRMNHSKTDYTNYERVYTPESGIDVEYKQKQQWERAFRKLTEKDLKEQIEFRQKLYKKHREDIQKQSKAKRQYIEQRLKQIGDKIQKILGKKIRSIYDKMISK